jgi:hypothetical protein
VPTLQASECAIHGLSRSRLLTPIPDPTLALLSLVQWRMGRLPTCTGPSSPLDTGCSSTQSWSLRRWTYVLLRVFLERLNPTMTDNFLGAVFGSARSNGGHGVHSRSLFLFSAPYPSSSNPKQRCVSLAIPASEHEIPVIKFAVTLTCPSRPTSIASRSAF